MAERRRLTMTRTPEESFRILDVSGSEVDVTIVEVRGRKVRIRVEAPAAVRILRDNAVVTEPAGMVGRRIET